MTTNEKHKQRVRARMERTGESYQAALQAMRAGRPEPPHAGIAGATLRVYQDGDLVDTIQGVTVGPTRMTDAEVFAEYGEHLGVPPPGRQR